MTEIVLVAGAGGVGKTTLAAGIGIASARAGRRTLVLTVDPARRLGTALGLKKLSNVAHPNPELDTLWAAMLDAGASWEAIARRHAPPDVADRLVTSPFFDAVARQFPAGAAYAAAEEMAEQVESGVWDLVVFQECLLLPREFTHVTFRAVHAFGPAEHPQRVFLHQRGGIGIPG